MTDVTSRVLADIDDAIEGYITNDYDVSADAMRWTPEPADDDEAAGDWQPVFDMDAARQAMNAFQQVVFPQFAQVQRAFAEIGKVLRRTVYANHHPVFAPTVYGDGYRQHYRSCCLCNPAGNPKPLPLNGTEYRRRTRSRRRRNRR